MADEVAQSPHAVLLEHQEDRRSLNEMKGLVIQMHTALLGIPGTDERGLVGEFHDHVAADAVLASRISRMERAVVVLFTGGIGTTSAVGYWDHIKTWWGG